MTSLDLYAGPGRSPAPPQEDWPTDSVTARTEAALEAIDALRCLVGPMRTAHLLYQAIGAMEE